MAKAFSSIAAKALQSAAGKSDSRAKLMGAIRAACNRKQISDDDRKAIQLRITGVASMADMEIGDLAKLLDHLNSDWKGPMGHRAYVGKTKALWWSLYWLGAINEPGDAALDAFVKRQTGKSYLRFLGHREAFRVIEALKAWAAREDVIWPTEEKLQERQRTDPGVDMAQLERHAVLEALSVRLRRFGAMSYFYAPYCEAALKLAPNHFTWSPVELDACIRLLGKRLRRELGKREASQ
ncbi:MAG TPA: regulatory protein GemA [Allosphingosinicella sp.]